MGGDTGAWGGSNTGGAVGVGGSGFAGDFGGGAVTIGGGLGTTGGVVQVIGGTGPSPTGGSLGTFGTGGSGSSAVNPVDCATMNPFVLSIDPSGDQGSVSGWLTGVGVAFDQQLPRFSHGIDDTADISMKWSGGTGGVGDQNVAADSAVTFRADGTGSSPIEIGVVTGAQDFSSIDRNAVKLRPSPVETVDSDPVKVGDIVVFHSPDNDVWLAMRVDAIYFTDTSGGSDVFTDPSPGHTLWNGLCSAIDVSWTFSF